MNIVAGRIKRFPQGGRYIDYSTVFGGGKVICGISIKDGAPASARKLEALVSPNTRVVAPLQIHSPRVRVIKRGELTEPRPRADALITNNPSVCLTVSVADCLPLYVHDPELPAVGIAHLGWRGMVAGIVENSIESFQAGLNSCPDRIKTLLGPCIGKCCYGVTPEVAVLFPEEFIESRKGQLYLDLKGVAVGKLEACGLLANNIFSVDKCTSCENELFCSHRADGNRSGRMLAFIQIGGESTERNSLAQQEAT